MLTLKALQILSICVWNNAVSSVQRLSAFLASWPQNAIAYFEKHGTAQGTFSLCKVSRLVDIIKAVIPRIIRGQKRRMWSRKYAKMSLKWYGSRLPQQHNMHLLYGFFSKIRKSREMTTTGSKHKERLEFWRKNYPLSTSGIYETPSAFAYRAFIHAHMLRIH